MANQRTSLQVSHQSEDRFGLSNPVVLQNPESKSESQRRVLNLNEIKTDSLRPLAPNLKEVESLKIDRTEALAAYADRLRQEYKANTNGLRNGFKTLSDAFDSGDRITITCSCRSGELCHADVVKMAIEKVNLHVKAQQANREHQNNRSDFVANSSRPLEEAQQKTVNPRTQRAINEIFSISETDRILGSINQTDGRNQTEQASYLGGKSQFVRDLYERGANVVSGNLIVPVERTKVTESLAIETQEYAVKRIGKILNDEAKAKEIAPNVIEYGNKIAGTFADGETKTAIFSWIYDSLEGRREFLETDGQERPTEPPTFDEVLETISVVADQMNALEPTERLEMSEVSEFEKDLESSVAGITSISFERIELGNDIPKLPDNRSEAEIEFLINEVLPEIDRKLENGVAIKEILKPFNENIRESANENAIERLGKIYRSNASSKSNAKPLDTQLEKINILSQNVLEINKPTEFREAQESAIKAFYRKSLQESARVISKLDEIREIAAELRDGSMEKQLKKELYRIQDAKPSFAFKIAGSQEIVVGLPSKESVEERNFVSSYIKFQLKQPETKLRHENERYRSYALQLEAQTTKSGLAKTASEIRAENATLGLKWKDLEKSEKETQPRPLTQKEMQFLFTESSPAHFTSEMTALKLSFSHSGASRHSMTESLKKGELKPSPEATKLIESLESRLNRRDIKDSISATKHFFESIKTPNESLKHKNAVDHHEIYTSLPPFEKDFVYQKATETLSNLKITAEKPLSLRLFESEFKKAEKELIVQNSKEKRTDYPKLAKSFNSEALLTAEDREQIKASAIETVIEKLEPKELSLDDPKMPKELTLQAIRTTKQLERAGAAFSSNDKTSAIRGSFLELDRETAKLRNLREEIHKSNQMELLKNSIKQDVVDLLKETAGKSESKLESRFSEIVSQNLTRAGLIDKRDMTQEANELAVRINERLISKQLVYPVLGDQLEPLPRTDVGEIKQHESSEIQRQFQSLPRDINRNSLSR